MRAVEHSFMERRGGCAQDEAGRGIWVTSSSQVRPVLIQVKLLVRNFFICSLSTPQTSNHDSQPGTNRRGAFMLQEGVEDRTLDWTLTLRLPKLCVEQIKNMEDIKTTGHGFHFNFTTAFVELYKDTQVQSNNVYITIYYYIYCIGLGLSQSALQAATDGELWRLLASSHR